MGKIDIGAAATGRSITFAAEQTYIAMDNPAEEDGVITKVEVYAASNISGMKVGTFYGTSNLFTSRDWVLLGSVTAGSKQTFTGLRIQCEAGDYIGCYFSSGTLERDTSGGSDVFYEGADTFDQGQQSYSQAQYDIMSLYGEGYRKVASGPLPMHYRKE